VSAGIKSNPRKNVYRSLTEKEKWNVYIKFSNKLVLLCRTVGDRNNHHRNLNRTGSLLDKQYMAVRSNPWPLSADNQKKKG